MSDLLTLEDAQSRLLELAPKPHSVRLGIAPSSLKRFLASDHTAQRTQPAADLSAMDGYAIGSDPGPWKFVGESRAGLPFNRELEPGQCIRISTGAHMPQGADRVLIQENATVDGGTVSATELPPPERHVRKAGFDFAKGDTILLKGAPCTPATLALAAAGGLSDLQWVEPPTVAVLDSGDELVPVGEPVGLHQIPASNAVMLGAMLHPYVGEVDTLGPVPDDKEALAQALKRAEGNHILVTSGGASVGDHDLIQQALIDWGADLAFWKVGIKPGKPLMVATRDTSWGRQVIIGLPGNPVSSFVTCFLFVLPLVRAAMGDPDPLPKTIGMIAGEDFPAVGSRREFLRGIHDGFTVRLTSSQDSSALQALANANCLIDRLPGSPAVAVGEQVSVYNLQNG